MFVFEQLRPHLALKLEKSAENLIRVKHTTQNLMMSFNPLKKG
jgi:hypothetical protein